MEDLLVQIELALKCNLYYLALQSALTLPDICSSLINVDGTTSGSQYISWFDDHAKEDGDCAISGSDCYKFRCSNLHQGSSINSRSSYSRIMFIEPVITNISIHNCIMNDALCIDLNRFCNNLISAVRTWLVLVKNDSNFKKNYPKLIKRYPDGIAPYIGGLPVIS